MANDRWKRIEQLYHAALEREGNQRAAFLQECAGDEQIRREVESLLAQEASGDELLERPALEVAAKMIGENRGKSLIGSRLGGYEIQSLLGAGGMGEVYKARDTKLRRDVAIKVIPAPFAGDRERIVRFRREAQLLASLNHPSIAAIYGLEEAEGATCLVMELVPGKTLSERIRQGAVPVEEALTIGKQIAEAMEAAHQKSVVHRDLKPANVKVTPEGKVKVLDFGLAKAFGDGNEQAASEAPTMITAGNQPGRILGTPPYMSPEQASGKTVDKRTDIWAFGCVLYELLSGKQAFAGESVTDILGAVMHKEPDWSALPPETPPAIRTLLRRCLQKDARERFRDAGDIRIQIEEARAASTAIETPSVLQVPAPRRWLTYVAVACVTAAITGVAVWRYRPIAKQPVTRFGVVMAENPFPQGSNVALVADYPNVALSPNGANMVYRDLINNGSGTNLFVRAMDRLDARPLDAESGVSPFFSPDGEWVGFFAQGKLKKVRIDGGAAITLCDVAGRVGGGTWGTDDTIVFIAGSASPLLQVSASGGIPKALTHFSSSTTELDIFWPEFLPGGKALIYANSAMVNPTSSQIILRRMDTGAERVLIDGSSYARYVEPGYIVFYQAGNILAARFDLKTLEMTGAPVPVVEGVNGSGFGGGAQFSVASQVGALAYIATEVGPGTYHRKLVWVDRKGAVQPTGAPEQAYGSPRISPDGGKVAAFLPDVKNDIWVYDLARSTLTRLTFEGENINPIWSPDGKRIAFASRRNGPINLYWKPADGAAAEEQITKSEQFYRPSSISPDGKLAFYVEINPTTGKDIWQVNLEGDHKASVFLQTPRDETSPEMSPDGHWMAYVSNETGRNEIYVRPYPGPGGKWQISNDGGEQPVWARNGKELFFRNADKMMVVDISASPAFVAGSPRVLFTGTFLSQGGPGPNFDVTANGQRFLMVQAAGAQATRQINVVLNWFEELKLKVPTGK